MNDETLPETRYAQSEDVNIAYQVMGDGPIDIVLVPGLSSNIEMFHELPGYTATLRRLARFARVITFDKRGQGISDRMSGAPSLEQRMDDVRAVMDEVGSRRTAILSFSEGACMSALFAATYPERVSHLILFGGFSRSADLWPKGLTPEQKEKALAYRVKKWGNGDVLKAVLPSFANEPGAAAVLARMERLCSTPGGIRTILELNAQIDVTSVLPTIQVPTLVLHRVPDLVVPVELGRQLAAQIPRARYVEYPEGDHGFWTGNTEMLVGDIEEFLTGHRDAGSVELERILATVMFTDIVDSTRQAAELGDQQWTSRLDEHDNLARQTIARHRGVLVKSTGDGVLATFDGPGRAIRCALSFSSAARQIGLPVRAGLHTGEIELRGDDIGGIAVHAAARVMAQSAPDEVLVSRVVTDLVAGAGLRFSDRGSHELKGLPGKWDLFAAIT
ncbi:MAG TPA: adenylate/guanylate cyclase domain-containing protein [Bradyrhizobium sp.]|nr:adenylate/guanylate cyclase domain-containing protein [Bradyrhizobium sp.]